MGEMRQISQVETRRATSLHPSGFRGAVVLLLFFTLPLFAQQPTIVELLHANALSFDKERFPDRQILRGEVQFLHDNVQMFCDSAYFYSEKNSLDAFGNVQIIQGDTLFIYSDKLFYDGNTKLARLRQNVLMENRDVTLNTENFDYDRVANMGHYFDGGELADSLNTLVSLLGYYYPDTKIAEFKQEVILENPDFTLYSDTLTYNTDSRIANIVGPSRIQHKDGELYSEKGWYNTQTEESELTQNPVLQSNNGRTLRGDTLFYNKAQGIMTARRNVEMLDSLRQITLKGNNGFYDEIKEFGRMTDRAMLIEHSSADTLFLAADTLTTVADSIYTRANAFHNVRFFRNNVQGKCDSLSYSSRDSLLNMYKMPVTWSENQQLTGDSIRAYFKNGDLDRVHVIGSAMAVSQDDSIRFNQVSGKEITGYFRDSVIYRAVVNGNVRSIYFVREDDGSLLGVNKAESSEMIIDFDAAGEAEKMVMMPAPQGILFPPEQLSGDELKLDGFLWQDEIRPKKMEDIFLRFAPPPVQEKKAGRRRR
jgi:lipopolysaccharide export system protein LptA